MQGKPFNAQGVTGVLNGTKTMFRVPLELHEKAIEAGLEYKDIENIYISDELCHIYIGDLAFIETLKYKIGEIVFVQEEFVHGVEYEYGIPKVSDDEEDWIWKTWYRADEDLDYWQEGDEEIEVPWQPASEMTQQQSRCKIRITGIKAERLQDISEEDCVKEGVKTQLYYGATQYIFGTGAWKTYSRAFHIGIWQPLPYPLEYQWEANPPVIAYTFEVVK